MLSAAAAFVAAWTVAAWAVAASAHAGELDRGEPILLEPFAEPPARPFWESLVPEAAAFEFGVPAANPSDRPDWLRGWNASDPAGDTDDVVALLAPHRGTTALTETSLMGRALASKGRLRADAWTDFDGAVRYGGQLVATTWLRAAVDTEAYVWEIDRPATPDRRFAGTFYTGDLNVVAQVIGHKRGTLRTGVGAAWFWAEEDDPLFGPQATIALDANLLGPATAGFEIDYGALDGDELFRWRAEGGWVWGLAEVRGGYDRLTIGDERRGGWFASLLVRY